MIRAIILLLWYSILAVPVAAIGIPWRLLSGDIMPLYRMSLWLVRTGLHLVGIETDVQGCEHVPANQACIFMSNHISNMDPPVLVGAIPGRTSIFLKRSLMKIPLLGLGMKLADFIPVDRAGRLDSARESVHTAARLLGEGIHITTFVEGTRSRDGRLMSFKKGPFYLAMDSGAPVIPVSIWGTEKLMPVGSKSVIPGTAHVRFHEPLWPKDFASREALMSATRDAVASSLPEWMREPSASPRMETT
ncbi:MAG TPA: lysophospholipid acyltransferase family protein [Acidisarcina sp.]|nr:lysophospholipid acyltransferase family protein [Acidisarcina sp.]